MAVLNNRFIRLHQADFNVIPPADVPEPTDEELAEEELQSMKEANSAGAVGRDSSSAGRGFGGRRGGSAAAAAAAAAGRGGRTFGKPGPNGRFSNKRYVALKRAWKLVLTVCMQIFTLRRRIRWGAKRLANLAMLP